MCINKAMILIILLSQFACAEQSLEQSTKLYCEFYNPENWIGVNQDTEIQEIFGQIILKQEKMILREDVKSVLSQANTSNFSEYYNTVKKGLSSLLDKPWECPFFEDFYLPKQKIISISLEKNTSKRIDPLSPDVITVMLTENGSVLINNAELTSSDAETIKKALLSLADENNFSDKSVIVYFDSGSDGGRVAGIFSILLEIGIAQIDLINI